MNVIIVMYKILLKLLTLNFISPAWSTDLKASHVHTSLISTHLDKLLAIRGFFQWGGICFAYFNG